MAPNPRLSGPALTTDTLDRWFQCIRPNSREAAFARVGFFTTLWEAVLEANRHQKPILLWAMNGHPMACT